MTAINTVDATADPDLYVHAGFAGYSTSPPVLPTFASGSLCIDTTTMPATITGTFGDFVLYSTSVKVLIFGAAVNQPDAVYGSGLAVGADVGGLSGTNRTGDTWYSFSFSTTP